MISAARVFGIWRSSGWGAACTGFSPGKAAGVLCGICATARLSAHSFDFYVNLTLVPAARMAGVPVIGSQRQLGDLLTAAQSRAQLQMFRWCDRVVCNSQAAADRLVQAGLRASKLVVIGNALPPAAFAKTPPALPRNDGLLRVGLIGRMNIRAKNQDSFLRAAGVVGQPR